MSALAWTACFGRPALVDLSIPVSDALSKSGDSWTALMYAACFGHSTCVQLLLPASDVFARDGQGNTAWMLAGQGRHAPLAEMIAAYAFAIRERLAIDLSTVVGERRKAAPRRV